MEQIRPDYGGACVDRIVPALLGLSNSAMLPEPARDAEHVVLLVIDGLGWNIVQRHRAQLPNLASMDGGPITTVLPSTTTSALPSITTGVAPARHGIVGFRMFIEPSTLHVLSWAMDPVGPAPIPFELQPIAPFAGRAIPVVSRSAFAKTPFTVAHMRGTQYFGWFTTSTLVERCRMLVRAGERLSYAYYDGVDHVAHTRGLNDAFFDAELAFADRLAGELLDAMPARAALVVTADHGQVALGESSWVSLDGLAPMIRAHSGDPRMRFLHAVDGAADELFAGARDACGDNAWVFSRAQVIEQRLLGPSEPSADVAARIGDVVLCARDTFAFADPGLPEEVRLRSMHGSMTADEMNVPLIAARGRASS